MNPKVQENEIRELYRELRREDERLAPPFVRDWAAAFSRSEQVHPRRRMFLLPVAASIMVILLGSLAFIFFRSPSTQTVPSSESAAVIIHSTPPVSLSEIKPSPHISKADRRQATPPNVAMGSGKERPKVVPRRLPSRRQPSALISRWRSPTDFLLKSSDEQLLKTVPRLTELPAEIKAIGSDETNRRKKTK